MRGVVTLAAAFVDPRGHAAPRGAAADRLHRGGRHAVHPGPDAAVAGAPAAGAVARPAARTRWPGRRCCSRRPRPASSALDELEYDDPHGVVDADPAAASSSATSPPGSGSAPTADEETPSELYARVRLEMLDAERGRVLEIRSTGHGRHEVVSDVLADARRRGVDARHRQPRSASELRASHRGAPYRRRPATHLERHPRRRDRTRTASCERLPARGHARGCACGSASSAATSACCDSSPRRHATAHFHDTSHPVMRVRRARRGLALVLRPPPDRRLGRDAGPGLRVGGHEDHQVRPSCVRLEHDGQVVVIDPGCSPSRRPSTAPTAVLITHEHPDHYLPDHLRATDAPVFTIDAVADKIRDDAPGRRRAGHRGRAGGGVRPGHPGRPPSASCTP